MCIITLNKNDKVEIYIDLMNLEKAARTDLDYSAICDRVAKGRPVCKAVAFDSNVGRERQKALHTELRKEKIEVRMPEIRCSDDGKQKGVDVLLATTVVERAFKSHCDVMVVVSGDGDFEPIIEKVKDAGKKIEFASFYECASSSLVDKAEFMFLDDQVGIRKEKAANKKSAETCTTDIVFDETSERGEPMGRYKGIPVFAAKGEKEKVAPGGTYSCTFVIGKKNFIKATIGDEIGGQPALAGKVAKPVTNNVKTINDLLGEVSKIIGEMKPAQA